MNKSKNHYIILAFSIGLVAIFLLLASFPMTTSIYTIFTDQYGTDYGAILVMNFEEGIGTTAFDQSPYGNDGTITDAAWAAGKFGEALTFDGNDYVTVSDSDSLDVADNITIEAWGKDPPIPFGAELGGDFEIIGDAVVVNDSRVYLSAEPHTIGSSGWVEFNLMSKQYSGSIDLVWGFNQTESRPSRPQYWINYSHTLYRWVEVEKTYTNETTGEEFNYTSHDKEYCESWFYDWKDINLDFNKRTLDAKGMDTWYVLKGIPVIASREYNLRCWVEIPFAGNDIVRGKYAWGIKLSSDTIQQAINKDRFYFMDPWYDSSWLYRTKITVDSGDVDEALTNFTVMVYLNSSRINWAHVQDDLDDLRFTSDDETTLLDYEIEDYTTNVEAWLWVRLPTVSNTADEVFYMYYDNTGAASGEDVEGTWDPSAVMVQHLQEATNSTCVDSTVYDNDGAPLPVGDPPTQVSGQVDGSLEFDGTEDYVDCLDNIVGGFNELTVSVWVYGDDFTTDKVIVGQWDPANQILLYYDVGLDKWRCILIDSAGLISDTGYQGTPVTDVWFHIVLTFDKDGSIILYEDGTEVGRDSNAPDGNPIKTVVDSFLVGWSGSVHPTWNGTIDEVRVYNTILIAAQIKATYESERDHLLTFGSEIVLEKVIVQKHDAYVLGISGDDLIGIINSTECTYLITDVTEWHYYAMTYDSSNIRLYIDGVLVNTTACTGSIATNANDVLIGNRWVGEIDQVRIYTVPKTVGEIRNHYLNSGHMYSGSVIVSDNFRVLNSTLDEQLQLDEHGLDLNHNYVLNSDFSHWLQFTFEGGATDIKLNVVGAGVLIQNRHFHRITLTVDTAPGAGKEVNVTLTDGTNTMFVDLVDAETADWTETGEFDWDVSAQDLTLTYSQTAGGAATKGFITIKYHYKETP